jgi:hypothetical protein
MYEKKEYTKEELITKLNDLNFTDFTLFAHMRKNFDYVEKMTYIINKSAKKLKEEFTGFENEEDDYTHYIPAYERNTIFYGVMSAEQIKRSFVIRDTSNIDVSVSYAKQIRIATLILKYKGFTFELYADCRNNDTDKNVYIKRMSFKTKTKINKKGLDEISVNMVLNKRFYYLYGLAEAATRFNLDNLLKEVNVTKILARGIADAEA